MTNNIKRCKKRSRDDMEEHNHSINRQRGEHELGYKGISDSDRKRKMDPDLILPRIGLRPGMTIVDVGCGQGFFALPAARIVGPKGRVYGIDVDETALDLTMRRAADAGLSIFILKGEAEETLACEGCADIVFFGISLHDLDDPEKGLANACKMLKPGGVVAILDGKKPSAESNAISSKGLSENDASALVKKTGFSIESIENMQGWLYLILARR